MVSVIGFQGYAPSLADTIEEEKYRREGKGRRCFFEDGIHSIPCRSTDLLSGWFEEKDE